MDVSETHRFFKLVPVATPNPNPLIPLIHPCLSFHPIPLEMAATGQPLNPTTELPQIQNTMRTLTSTIINLQKKPLKRSVHSPILLVKTPVLLTIPLEYGKTQLNGISKISKRLAVTFNIRSTTHSGIVPSSIICSFPAPHASTTKSGK